MSMSEYLGIRDWRPLGWPTAHVCDICGVTVSDEARAAKHQAWHALVDVLIEREAATGKESLSVHPIARRAVLAEMTRDETADGLRADGFPGATSSALGDALREIPVDRTRVTRWVLLDDGTRRDLADQADALTAERDRLRDDCERTRVTARVEAALAWEQVAADLTRERDEARAEAEAAHEGRINALNRVTAMEVQRDDLAAQVARQREDGQRKDAALVRAKGRRRDAEARAAHWKVNAGLYDAAALLNIERANDAEDAIARVRALLDGRAMVPVGLLAEALDGELQPRKSGDDPAQGSTAGGNGARSDAGAAEASPSGPGATRAAEGQESVSDWAADHVEAICAWSDYRREYGVSAVDAVRRREHSAFHAGWQAARGTLDLGGVQR